MQSRRRNLWVIGGGKKGVGKTLVAASISMVLARMGKPAIAVDASTEGTNLQNYLGITQAGPSFADLLENRASEKDVLKNTAEPGLRLIAGASGMLDGKPAIRPKRKNRPLPGWTGRGIRRGRPGGCDLAPYAGLFQHVRRRNPDSHTRPALHAPCLRFRTTRAIPEYPEEIRLRALRPGSLKGVCRKSRRVQAQDDDGFLRAIVLDRPVERR